MKHSPLFDPGAEWHYSNTNTMLLGLVLQQVTGEFIGELYRQRIMKPLGLQQTSFPNAADPSLPESHAQGYSSSPGYPSKSQTPGIALMLATGTSLGGDSRRDDLYCGRPAVYGSALGSGEGLLPPEQQAVRLNSFLRALPPLNAENSYGLGLAYDHGRLGHGGELPGFNTTLSCPPELDATMMVEVNSDNDLTKDQINEANGDEHTKLPDYLQRPAYWSRGEEEKSEAAS
jgi:D-alanyl-D-alanine carboxypeptidase